MLVLASASPRRRELLTQAGYSFQVQPSSVPEEPRPGEEPIALAVRLAREKSLAVFSQLSAGPALNSEALLVLGADTVVVGPDGEIFGKPADAADAARMLRRLSGATHQVITGVCVTSSAGSQAAAEVTAVAMQTFSDEEIAAYVRSGEPMDKAGAYAIQGYAGRWIPRIQGCYFNVVGLPLALTASLIEGMAYRHAHAGSAMPSAENLAARS